MTINVEWRISNGECGTTMNPKVSSEWAVVSNEQPPTTNNKPSPRRSFPQMIDTFILHYDQFISLSGSNSICHEF
jgi:hypothetical protein